MRSNALIVSIVAIMAMVAVEEGQDKAKEGFKVYGTGCKVAIVAMVAIVKKGQKRNEINS